jgi:hypothetical protein
MNLDRFRREFSQLILRGKELERISPHIQGTNSPLIQHTINLAVSCLEEGEAYFEVGCLFGSSFASACRDNDGKVKYACDMQWQGQMSTLMGMPNVHSIESKYEDVELDKFLQHPVGVYYFDGPHDYDDSLVGLCRILPHLADKALILYDDIDGYGRAYNAWRQFAKTYPDQVTIVHEFWTPDQFIACTKGYPDGWWDGFAIAEFERNYEMRDQEIEGTTIAIWHGMGVYKPRHGTLHPEEFKHIHGKEEHKWE